MTLPDRIPSSTTDRVLSMGLDKKAADEQGRVLVYFDGRVDEVLLEKAIALTVKARPILGYRFVPHNWRSYWQRVEEKDREPIFRSVHSSTGKELHDFMKEPCDPLGSPQIRVGLFRAEKDTICILVNHMIMDGGGAKAYLGLLSTCYRELQKDPDFSPAVRLEREDWPRQVLKRGGIITAIRGLPSIEIPGTTWGVPKLCDDRSGRAFMIRQIEPARMAVIKKYAKSKGVTINDVLLTAYYRSLFELLDVPYGESRRIEVPVNLRRYLHPDEADAIGNVAGIYFALIDRRKGETFDDLLVRVHALIEDKKERQEELAEMLLIELVLFPGMFLLKGMARSIDFEVAHPVLTNLGTVEAAAADFGNVAVDDVRMLGPVFYPPNVGLGVNTFRERMTLSLTYCDTAVSTDVMNRLFELLLKELPGEQATA